MSSSERRLNASTTTIMVRHHQTECVDDCNTETPKNKARHPATGSSTSAASASSMEACGLKRSWDHMYSRLLSYREIHGDCCVPKRYEPDKKLGTWVATQRRQHNLWKSGKESLMTRERAQKLDRVEFVWALRSRVSWKTRYRQLLAYKKQHGNCEVPIAYKNKQLSNWVSKQRQLHARKKLLPDRICKLEAVGFRWRAQRGCQNGQPKSAQHEQSAGVCSRGLPTSIHELPSEGTADEVPKLRSVTVAVRLPHNTEGKSNASFSVPRRDQEPGEERNKISGSDQLSPGNEPFQQEKPLASNTGTAFTSPSRSEGDDPHMGVAPFAAAKNPTPVAVDESQWAELYDIDLIKDTEIAALQQCWREEGGLEELSMASSSSLGDNHCQAEGSDKIANSFDPPIGNTPFQEKPIASTKRNACTVPPFLPDATDDPQTEVSPFRFESHSSLEASIKKCWEIVSKTRKGGPSVTVETLDTAEMAKKTHQQLTAFRDGLPSSDALEQINRLEEGKNSACHRLDFKKAKEFQIEYDNLREKIIACWCNSFSEKDEQEKRKTNGSHGSLGGLPPSIGNVKPLTTSPGSGVARSMGGLAITPSFQRQKRDTTTAACPALIASSRKTMRLAMSEPHSDLQELSYQYLERCTDTFSEKRQLGKGSFSDVFLGLDNVIRRKFAVKRFKVKFSRQDADFDKAKTSFEREIWTLKHFRHPNIARLHGFCMPDDTNGYHCLVFQLAAKGSLNSFLQVDTDKEPLHWTTRINIAVDVSRAVRYLHKGSGGKICYHRDIKSGNVCLQRDFTALLIDCGVSQVIPEDESESTMTIMGEGIRGTPGYICPTYARTGGQYVGAYDVFSLGIMLAELITGILQLSETRREKIDLFDLYSDGGSQQMQLGDDADTSGGDWDKEICENFAQLAVECISHVPRKRPRIEDIVQRLESLASMARPWSLGERNLITVLFSAPLVWRNRVGKLTAIEDLNVGVERDLMIQCIKEAGRDITLTFDVATIDRLQAAATKRSGCLHFSGHGHLGALVCEDGTGGARFLKIDGLRDLLPRGAFKFVFVAACHSEPVGRAFVEAGCHHVVCCEQESRFRDDAAMRFTRAFYHALAEAYSIKTAFHMGKMAVNSQFGQTEMEKYMLLPEDGNHDIPVFAAEKLEWIDDSVKEHFIPSPPSPFVGRQIDMYRVISFVLSKRQMTLVGEPGMGCSSLAAAVCQYIDNRKTTILGIEATYFVRSRDHIKALPAFFKPLHRQMVEDGKASILPDGADTGVHVDSMVDALQGVRALIVFDGADPQDEELGHFVKTLLERTNTVRILLTARAPMDPPTVGLEENIYRLDPLTIKDAVTLFNKKCPHGKNLLSILATDKGRLALFERIGGGVPARIISAAETISREECETLASLREV